MKHKEGKDRHVMLDEVVVTDKSAPRERIKQNGYEDLLPVAVEFLPEQEVNEMQNKATSAVRASRVNTNPERLNVQPDKGLLPVGVEFISDGDMEDLQNNIKVPQKESSAVLPEVKNSARGGIDNPYELPEVEVTASAPRQEKLKKVVPIADVVDEVKPLPYERVNEMQRRATNAVRTAYAPKVERLNIPKYNVKEDLSVGVEPLYDDEMEELQGRIKQPVQTIKGAELPEVEVVAKRNNDVTAQAGPEVNRDNPYAAEKMDLKYEHDLPKNIEQRDIKPVAVKEGSEKQGKQRRTLKDILDEVHNSRREMTPDERARWERNAAIMGDIARLGAQSYAVGNGAWKTEKAESETKKANERRRALQEREYARMAQQAKDAREQERWQKKFDADKEHQQWMKDKFAQEQEQKQEELDFKQKQHDDNIRVEQEKLKNKAKTALETENITVNGKTYSKEKDGANYLIKAYVDAGRPPITRRVQKKNDVGGYEYNEDGSAIYLDVPVSNPTEAEIAMALLGANTAGKKMAGFKGEKSAGFSK